MSTQINKFTCCCCPEDPPGRGLHADTETDEADASFLTIPPGDSSSGIVSTTSPDTSASTSQLPPAPLSGMAALFWLSMALRMLTSHSDEVGGGRSGDLEDVEGMGRN